MVRMVWGMVEMEGWCLDCKGEARQGWFDGLHSEYGSVYENECNGCLFIGEMGGT